MISLKEYLTEGILDVDDNLGKDYIKIQIEDFIKENYNVYGKLQIKYSKNGYIVNCRQLIAKQGIIYLTNDLFKFGCIKYLSLINCLDLKSLKGAPQKCDTLHIKNCGLINLIGAPEVVDELIITNCKYLESLEGCPKVVNRWAQIYDNPKLKSIENFPEKIDGDFLWTNNDVGLTEEDIRRICRVKGEIKLNY